MGTIDQTQAAMTETIQLKSGQLVSHGIQRVNAMESKLLSLLTVLSIAITAVVVVYLFTGPGYAIELAAVSLTALSAWLRWSFREPLDQRRLVAPYILVIVATLTMTTGRY